MPSASILLWGALLGALAFLPPTQAIPVQDPTGHLVLVVEGDVHGLGITAVVPKPDPFGGVPKGLTSDWQLDVLAADGAVLGSYPVDLSQFDLDPTRVGKPPAVEGCIVRASRVGMLLNIPDFPGAAELRFTRKGEPKGGLDAAGLRRLRAGGGR